MAGGTQDSAQPGDVIEGRWRLMEVLGEGGMGRVWKAHDARLDTHVALKELWLPTGLTPREHEERLRRAEFEALSAARLRDHPRIVTVHDVVVADGRPWIVMQLVTGGTLHERLARRPLPPRRAGPLAPLITALLAKDPMARPTVAGARARLPPDTPGTDSEAPDLDDTAGDGTARRETSGGTRLLTSVHFPAATVVTTATVKIRNKGSAPVRVLIAGEDRGTVEADATGTFRTPAGVHSIRIRSRGEASAPPDLPSQAGNHTPPGCPAAGR